MTRLHWTWLCWAPIPAHVWALWRGCGWPLGRSVRQAIHGNVALWWWVWRRWRWTLAYYRREVHSG